jgi:3-dehydrosphinganine reductase
MELWLILAISIVGGLLVLVLLDRWTISSAAHAFQPKDKHCYITGASQGLGRSLARLLAQRGAHITIVARNVANLQSAVVDIKAAAINPDQRVHYLSADLTHPDTARNAFKEAIQLHGGHVPDYVFCCAGGAYPGFLLDQPASTLQDQINGNYLVGAFTVHAAVSEMKDNNSTLGSKVVMVSSVLGMMGLVGYGQYVAAKYAICGFADSIRHEFLMYGIDVHLYLPGNMMSPGFDKENETKPKVTAEIEGTVEAISTDEAALTLIKGIERGQYVITSDFVGQLLASTVKPTAPGNGIVSDRLLQFVTLLAFPIWRLYADYLVKAEGKRR